MHKKPQLIHFPKIGSSSVGYISIGEVADTIPFEIKRVFWTYYTPESIVRGRHAHHYTEMVLVAVSGRIIVNTELPNGEIETFILERPDQGVYLPPYSWHTMQYSHNAVQMVFASTVYSETDYIRSYEEFKAIGSDPNSYPFKEIDPAKHSN
ncbi:MAG: FdtA/QdtA family cupin domain-containing protein [Bacteroidota bacterium]